MAYFEIAQIRVRFAEKTIVDSDFPDADAVIATWWETAEWVAQLSPTKGAKVFMQGHEVFLGLPLDRVTATYHVPIHKIVVADWLVDVVSKGVRIPRAVWARPPAFLGTSSRKKPSGNLWCGIHDCTPENL